MSQDSRVGDIKKGLSRKRRYLALAGVLATAATYFIAPVQQDAAEAAGPVGVFASDEPGAVQASTDTGSVEVGMRFSAKTDGSVTGIKAYKAASAASATPRSGTLWNSSGQPLATVDFTATTATGWRAVQFSSPVEVTAGETYTVSVFAPEGRYPATYNGLAESRSTDYLSTPSRNNGVFAYARKSTFPTESFRSTNYWVDVQFVPGNTQPTQSAGTTSPSSQPATTTPSPSSTTSPSPSTTSPTSTPPSSSGGSFPTSASTGVPAGWGPAKSVTGNFTVSTPGSVIEDLRITNGSLIINASDVTVRRVEVLGGSIKNFQGSVCRTGLVIEDSTVKRAPGQTTSGDSPAIETGGYTARGVKIEGLPEGFRVGGKSSCGPVVIERSFASVQSPDVCGDWHGDGLQGYDGGAVKIRNSTIELVERSGCGGTAPFFYPHSQGNTSVDIDGLLVKGGGQSFRLGMPGTVQNLNIVDRSWAYAPINVKCSVVSSWDAKIVTLDSGGQPVTVRSQPCNTEQGN